MTTERLMGKIALVTGAASGIGRAVAIAFAGEGATVWFADRDEEGARRAAMEVGPRGRAIAMDISHEDSVAAAFAAVREEHGRHVDIVVANAGVQLFGADAPVADLDLATWRSTMDINLTGTFLTLKHAVRSAGRGASLIVTGSPTGITGEGAGFTAYSTSKAGVHGLVRTVAADYASAGIRVNTVVPGYTATPLVRTISDDADARASIVARVPLGRPGTPEDVIGIMVYLASEESSYATGGLFVVDGGMTSL
jgi:NAD(P)-dependent dehydrogenase (short-subunit alcohol dehydrogenase family)